MWYLFVFARIDGGSLEDLNGDGRRWRSVEARSVLRRGRSTRRSTLISEVKESPVKGGHLVRGLGLVPLARRPSEGIGCLRQKVPRVADIFLAVPRAGGGVAIHFYPCVLCGGIEGEAAV
jgi:hypothetical protein